MDYTTLYVKYNDELRPLISEFEGREEQFEEPILKSMAYVVDELSLCVQEKNADEQNNHYERAQKNLEEAVINCYKYLVYSHHKRLNRQKPVHDAPSGRKSLRTLKMISNRLMNYILTLSIKFQNSNQRVPHCSHVQQTFSGRLSKWY